MEALKSQTGFIFILSSDSASFFYNSNSINKHTLKPAERRSNSTANMELGSYSISTELSVQDDHGES